MRLNNSLTYGFLLAPLLLSGCSRAPSFDILGSFFPAWLVCFVVAIVLTAIIQLVLRRFRVRLAFPILAYASLAAFFTFALWLMFLD
jgi:Na+/glutamate symporter